MREIYSHATDEQGNLVPKTVGEIESDEDRFKRRWRERYSITEAQADVKWREFIASEAYRAHLEQTGGLAPEEVDRRVAEYLAKRMQER